MIEYKRYTGIFEYDDEYEFIAGHVVDTRDGINFEGWSVAELKGPCGPRPTDNFTLHYVMYSILITSHPPGFPVIP